MERVLKIRKKQVPASLKPVATITKENEAKKKAKQQRQQQQRQRRVCFSTDGPSVVVPAGISVEERSHMYFTVRWLRSAFVCIHLLRCSYFAPTLTLLPPPDCQNEDVSRFKRESLQTAIEYRIHHDHNLPWDDDCDTVRGIEHELRRSNNSGRANDSDEAKSPPSAKKEHARLVLEAQQKLWEESGEGRYDPEVLGRLASETSRECRDRATATGREDAEAAGYTVVDDEARRDGIGSSEPTTTATSTETNQPRATAKQRFQRLVGGKGGGMVDGAADSHRSISLIQQLQAYGGRGGHSHARKGRRFQ